MRTLGLSLGLALLCLMRVQAAEPGAAEPGAAEPGAAELGAAELGAADLEERQVAGTWYITAMASDSELYIKKKNQLKMAMANIEVLENGDLKVSFAIPTPERCMKFESIYEPTDSPDEYYSSDRGNKTVRLVNTDGRSYMVVLATKEKNGKTLRMLRLYSRTRSVRPQIKSLFKDLAKLNGFTDEVTWILPRQDKCRLDEP